jgi:hypothetical protein
MQNLTPPKADQLSVIKELEESLNIKIPQNDSTTRSDVGFQTNSIGLITTLNLI